MRFVAPIAVVLTSVVAASGDVQVGLLSDFTATGTGGWAGGAAPTRVAGGGPLGPDDAYLQVGDGGRLATYNTQLSGVIDPLIETIEVDLLRPAGESDLDVRLVLFGPQTSDRWTSTVAQTVPGDGQWASYSFSVLEDDLTRVLGAGGYSDLVADLDRIMFRYDPGTPSSRGQSVPGTLGLDNITARAALPVGDYTGDGVVDSADYTRWTEAYGDGPGSSADGNGDGRVDAADYTVWRDNRVTTNARAIPEPGAVALLMAALALFASRPFANRPRLR